MQSLGRGCVTIAVSSLERRLPAKRDHALTFHLNFASRATQHISQVSLFGQGLAV